MPYCPDNVLVSTVSMMNAGKIQYVGELLWHAVSCRLAGYVEVNAAEQLCPERAIGGGRW
jgi:hypothetical protein